MRYLYLDESYRLVDDHWHCVIGGLLLPPEVSVDLEMAYVDAVKSFPSVTTEEFLGEIKSTAFFTQQNDDIKLQILSALTKCTLEHGGQGFISHAVCRADRLPFQKTQHGHGIQVLAYMVVHHIIEHHLKGEFIQIVVDLGRSAGFNNIYDLYVGAISGLPQARWLEIPDELLIHPGYRNMPMPLFLDSRNSRLIQFADFIAGIGLKKYIGNCSAFGTAMCETVEPLFATAIVNSQEWNRDA